MITVRVRRPLVASISLWCRAAASRSRLIGEGSAATTAMMRAAATMGVTLLNVGFDNAVAAERVVAVVSADPAPIKRLRETAVRSRKLIDATNGRRTRTVLITDSDHVILSSLQPETLAQRLVALVGAKASA